MGFAMVTLDAPVTKTSSSILAFQKDEAAEAKETACINCGRCVEVCPAKRNLKQAIGSMRKIALANKRK